MTPNEIKPGAPQEELSKLYSEKGELVTQLEIAQTRLSYVNQRLSQILGLGTPQQGPIQVR